MGTHLRYSVDRDDTEHPQVAMKRLGITYQHATPQSIGDQWWFWNCENVPKQLPFYIMELNANPRNFIGFGLSEDLVEMIEGYDKG